jgi:cyclic pyranopterin phosphate synthase
MLTAISGAVTVPVPARHHDNVAAAVDRAFPQRAGDIAHRNSTSIGNRSARAIRPVIDQRHGESRRTVGSATASFWPNGRHPVGAGVALSDPSDRKGPNVPAALPPSSRVPGSPPPISTPAFVRFKAPRNGSLAPPEPAAAVTGAFSSPRWRLAGRQHSGLALEWWPHGLTPMTPSENRAMNDPPPHDKPDRLRMVDVSDKPVTQRRASAEAVLVVGDAVMEAIRTGTTPKGNVYEAARLAGMMAAKRTAALIPLCHVLSLDHVDVEFEPGADSIRIVASASTRAPTGAEMEALVAAAVAGLTLYDMLKPLSRSMVLQGVRLLAKSGGRSGDYRAATHPNDEGARG